MKLRSVIVVNIDARDFRHASEQVAFLESAVVNLRENGFKSVTIDTRERRVRKNTSPDAKEGEAHE